MGVSVWTQELDLMIIVGPFQLGIFCDSRVLSKVGTDIPWESQNHRRAWVGRAVLFPGHMSLLSLPVKLPFSASICPAGPCSAKSPKSPNFSIPQPLETKQKKSQKKCRNSASMCCRKNNNKNNKTPGKIVEDTTAFLFLVFPPPL